MQQVTAPQWPQKSREFQSALMDSTAWNSFEYREGDVVIATWAKSGTTWMQQIAAQLIWKGAENVEIQKLSPWIELPLSTPEAMAALEAQKHRRVLKTHLPVDALIYSARAKYIFVGRDGRDVIWSKHNHFRNLLPQFYEALNGRAGRVGPPLTRPPESALDYFREWMIDFGPPGHPNFWDHMRSWWSIRHLPNIRFVHFDTLKRDLRGEMRSISDFLGIDLTEEEFANAVSHCSFEFMKAHADRVAPRGGVSFEGGGRTFINKGSNGRWSGQLTAEESQAYEARALAELGPDCAAWLLDGTINRNAMT